VNAARAVAARAADGTLAVEDIDADTIAAELQLGDVPDPDLLIRTGGEQRISNFLLWNLAYAELFFCDTLWPDFGDDDFDAALEHFAKRQRRYGHTGEQIEAAG
jgi:undecaprenyl diphosphate synthase